MRAPNASYRLQLRAGLGLAGAERLLPYLEALGITDLYLEPIYEAEEASTHGYDVVSHQRIDPRIGGEDALRALARAAQARGIGVIADWVPNHMSVASDRNAAWQDVLAHGRASPHATTFDIEWSPPLLGLEGRILLPILGDAYGRVLERGELRLELTSGAIRLRYWERALPIAPATLAPLILRAASHLPPREQAEGALRAIATGLAALPGPQAVAPADAPGVVERARGLERRLTALIATESSVARAIDQTITEWNGQPGEPRSFDRLDALIGEQAYRPSAWKLALEAINYRRFFDVDHLAAIRMEEPAVFAAAHRHLFSLLADGVITGIRLDHVDGLADPAGYFVALQEGAAAAVGGVPAGERAVWVVAEKILGDGERLPSHWALDGTTGYELATAATGALVDLRAEPVLTAFYKRFTGDLHSFSAHAHSAKLLLLRTTFASEVRQLSDMLERIASADRDHRDLTPSALRYALEETIAAFPVYRSYVRADGSRERDDTALLRRALRIARRRAPERGAEAFDFVESVLTAEPLEPGDARSMFVLRFQQLTGPATAKAIEDTAFYRYVRFVAANEVGGEPRRIGIEVEALHRASAERAAQWPRTMLSTSTHDTKRGEDARARLAVLAEIPDPFRRAVSRWSRRARGKRTKLEDGSEAPSRRDEYLLYQTLIGAWPFAGGGMAAAAELAPRVVAYMEKATREAKEHTSWVRPDEEYEGATKRLVTRMLEDPIFVEDLERFCAQLDSAAVSNALAQVLIRTTSPGMPDLYQGSEVWNQSLVDPDNRRPVDFARLARELERLRAAPDPAARAAELLAAPGDGAIKLWVTHRALDARRRARSLYAEGDYVPLDGGEHCIAFARTRGDAMHVCAVARLPYALSGAAPPVGTVWSDRRIRAPSITGGARFRDALTERVVVAEDGLALAEVLAVLPCALLVAE
jgi:(1->4)-alpha-D-glucan 1-alpha-D-glucosylmutase